MSQVHAQARTTPRTRAEIKASSASLGELAERYNISRATARKWKHRDSPEDLSHRPHTLHTTLLPVQEAIAVELRRLLLLPLDDASSSTQLSLALAWIAVCAATVSPTCVSWLPRPRPMWEMLRASPSRPSRTMSRALCMWTSSTCRKCPMSSKDGICLWPLIAQRAGCSCTSMPIKARTQA